MITWSRYVFDLLFHILLCFISFFLSSTCSYIKQENRSFCHGYGLQAIKGVLEKDFPCEEETQPETVLYKNLWLEAEAALCSMSYRARFNRMKIEMEKCKSYKAKG